MAGMTVFINKYIVATIGSKYPLFCILVPFTYF